MKRTISLLLLVSAFILGCEKEIEIGEVLFCTNSAIINCPFSIEITIDNIIVDTLTAASEYTSKECSCEGSFDIGTTLSLKTGEHAYYAKELNCFSLNRTNEWSGTIEIFNSSCIVVNLDIPEMINWP